MQAQAPQMVAGVFGHAHQQNLDPMQMLAALGFQFLQSMATGTPMPRFPPPLHPAPPSMPASSAVNPPPLPAWASLPA
eukprot:5923910-Alexandrium_andersonii.AAC.1